MKRLRVSVTKRDITRAGVELYCPIAQSLRRRFKRQLVMVSRTKARIGFTNWLLPDIAVDFTIMFDKGKTVKPLIFTMTHR